MAAGDVTIIGPYGTTSTGMALLDTALTAIQSGAANDKVNIVNMVNNAGCFVVWIEGA